jgi:hypothetical protein
MKHVLILMAISLFAFQINAQTKVAKISFNESVYDFGQIQEANGKVSHKFEFVNTGSSPLIITGVNTSCGCTTPSWTNTPVAAGEKGFVDVTFNPQGYRSFTKSITVNTNGDPATVQLLIKGNVQSSQSVEPVKEDYKYEIGGVKLMSQHVGFGQINRDEKQTKTIEVFNSNTTAATLSFSNIPSEITILANPTVLEPNSKGTIVITYDAALKNDWDYVFDMVSMLVNGQAYGNNRINLSAIIKEDFSKLSVAELAKVPVISFDQESFSFGEIKEGAKVDFVFKLKNSGKSNLLIRKVSSSCGCTVAMPEKTTIEPGKTVDLKVSFDSEHKTGAQNKSITVISNDPKNPRIVLWVRGNVLPAEQ